MQPQFQELPDAPRDADGRPLGTPCRVDCRPPVRAHAHCTVCHSTLRTVSDFDDHRAYGRCVDLPTLGLIEVDRLWATPEGHAAREKLADDARARGRARARPPGGP